MRLGFVVMVLVMPLALMLGLAAYAIYHAAPPHEALNTTTTRYAAYNGQTAAPRPEKTR